MRKRALQRRQPERDYSHRALLDKLAVRPGQRVLVLGVKDAGFLDDLAKRVPDFSPEESAGVFHSTFFGAETVSELARLKSLVRAMRKDGAVWVVYPKGRKDIREADVLAAGKAAGLTDNKVCRFSESHTALRFVIPVAQR